MWSGGCDGELLVSYCCSRVICKMWRKRRRRRRKRNRVEKCEKGKKESRG